VQSDLLSSSSQQQQLQRSNDHLKYQLSLLDGSLKASLEDISRLQSQLRIVEQNATRANDETKRKQQIIETELEKKERALKRLQEVADSRQKAVTTLSTEEITRLKSDIFQRVDHDFQGQFLRFFESASRELQGFAQQLEAFAALDLFDERASQQLNLQVAVRELAAAVGKGKKEEWRRKTKEDREENEEEKEQEDEFDNPADETFDAKLTFDNSAAFDIFRLLSSPQDTALLSSSSSSPSSSAPAFSSFFSSSSRYFHRRFSSCRSAFFHFLSNFLRSREDFHKKYEMIVGRMNETNQETIGVLNEQIGQLEHKQKHIVEELAKTHSDELEALKTSSILHSECCDRIAESSTFF
jgi:hypothetical protein